MNSTMNSNEAAIAEESAALYDKIASAQGNDELLKSAAQDLSDYTRTHNREGSFISQIIEPSPFDRNFLVPQMNTNQPTMLFEYETASPGAYPVDFGTTPSDFIPRVQRYPLVLQRIQTQQVVVDLAELQVNRQDVRAILGDNMTKNLVARRDYRGINAARDIVGPVGASLPWSGKPHHVNTGTPLTLETFANGKNILRDTPFAIEPDKVLMSHLRRTQFDATPVEELQGTDRSVDIAFKGWTSTEWSGMKLIFTIKKKLIPYADTFWFGDQTCLGRYVQWKEPTMSLDKRDTLVSFYLYEYMGITFAHVGAVGVNQYL